METIMLDSNDVSQNINTGIDLVLKSLLDDSIITDDQFNTAVKYKIIVTNQNIFGRLLNKIFSKDNDEYKFVVVKLAMPEDNE